MAPCSMAGLLSCASERVFVAWSGSYHPRRRPAASSYLCQIPPKPQANIAIYGDTLKYIVVAGSCWSAMRWDDSVCVSTREEIQFPSVLLKPGDRASLGG